MTSDTSFRERAPVVAGGRVAVVPDEFETIRAAIDGGNEWYVAGLVRHEDRIAFVRNRWSEGWVLPGGGIEDDETMAAAVEREVREETGLSVDRRRPLAAVEQTFEPTARGGDDSDDLPEATAVTATAWMAVFEVVATDGTFGDDLGEDPTEIDEAAWFDATPARIDGLSRDLLGALVTEAAIDWPGTGTLP